MALTKDFGFGPDEILVRDSARKFLKESFPLERLRKLVAADHHAAYGSAIQPVAHDEALWQQIVELGWPALAVPANEGGVGATMIAVASLVEEIGRAALPSPLVSTIIATAVLRAAGAAAALAEIAGGTTATLAITDRDGSWRFGDAPVSATPAANGGVTLRGQAAFVQDARKVHRFVVSARSASGVGLYLVSAGAPGLTITPDRIVDLTRDQATLTFDGTPVAAEQILAAPGTGEQILNVALPSILTVIAADLCGAAEWQLQTTNEYAKIRTQFERPLGYFQAVKHPIVNMMLAVDRARSLMYAAACAIDHEPEDALRLARMAKAAAADAAAFASNRSIQLHGGIGFTWECDVHIYFKRQQHNEFLFGDATYQRARLAEIL